MNRINALLLCVGVGAIAMGVAATAQEVGRRASYGSVRINEYSWPLPRELSIIAGGDVNVAANIQGCVGYIMRNQDIRILYTPWNNQPLTFATKSDADTTLVISAPNGEWHCNDAGRPGELDAKITFTSPVSGAYDVWLGTKRQQQARATLVISQPTP